MNGSPRKERAVKGKPAKCAGNATNAAHQRWRRRWRTYNWLVQPVREHCQRGLSLQLVLSQTAPTSARPLPSADSSAHKKRAESGGRLCTGTKEYGRRLRLIDDELCSVFRAASSLPAGELAEIAGSPAEGCWSREAQPQQRRHHTNKAEQHIAPRWARAESATTSRCSLARVRSAPIRCCCSCFCFCWLLLRAWHTTTTGHHCRHNHHPTQHPPLRSMLTSGHRRFHGRIRFGLLCLLLRRR